MNLDKPCMNDMCANKLLDLAKSADTILEWGSGGSTIYMLNNISRDTIIYSIEHDISFYNTIKSKLNDSVVYTLAVEKNEYVNTPSIDIHYSFILVDGVHREECLRHTRKNLSWDILLLHDAERVRYNPWMDAFSDELYNKSFVKNLWICEKK